MPGYRVNRSDVKNTTLFDKYQCPHCHFLLRNAVQPLCGHWLCESCADDLFGSSSSPKCPRPDCQEDLSGEYADEGPKYFPDSFVRREIKQLVVTCPHHMNGCQWEDRLDHYEKHLDTCQFASQSCPDCGETMTVDKIQLHGQVCSKAKVCCPLFGYGCQHNQMMTRDEIEQHIKSHGLYNIEEMAQAMKLFKKISCDQAGANQQGASTSAGGSGCGEKLTMDLVESYNVIRPFVNELVSEDMESAGDYISINHPQRENHYSKKRSEMAGVDPLVRLEEEDLQKTRENLLRKQANVRSKEEDIMKLKRDVNSLQSMLESSNYDGSMIWKIHWFSQRMADAQSGRYTSIFSPPFYSGRYGYKMCLRLYILGDGIGKSTHMSLFFVIMKGEFDDILQWPFTHKVTFKLINQTGGRDIIDSFQPDPMSSSFRKPKSDMNIASGCPRFVSHTELKNGGFIFDEKMFIKCSIDLSSIKHP